VFAPVDVLARMVDLALAADIAREPSFFHAERNVAVQPARSRAPGPKFRKASPVVFAVSEGIFVLGERSRLVMGIVPRGTAIRRK